MRLRPQRRADAQDLFLAGQTGRVAGVHLDVDGATHVGVVLVDDPAADLHEWYGRYLYFGPEELEPLGATADRAPTEGRLEMRFIGITMTGNGLCRGRPRSSGAVQSVPDISVTSRSGACDGQQGDDERQPVRAPEEEPQRSAAPPARATKAPLSPPAARSTGPPASGADSHRPSTRRSPARESPHLPTGDAG